MLCTEVVVIVLGTDLFILTVTMDLSLSASINYELLLHRADRKYKQVTIILFMYI